MPETEKGSGRLELADWLTSSGKPLLARVMVNRIWQHHFGRGIVESPNDFGARGKAPTHPDLLDFLSTRFVQSGWSIKAMHRLLMLSHVYQIDSKLAGSPEASSASDPDPENSTFAVFNRRRLDAEEIRDAMLAISGTLDKN